MDYFKELQRIAYTLDTKKDKDIVLAASVKLIGESEPKFEQVTKVPNGIHHIRSY